MTARKRRTLTQRRKGAAKRRRVSKGFLCAFAPLREKTIRAKPEKLFLQKMVQLIADYAITLTRMGLESRAVENKNSPATVANKPGSL